MDDLIKLLGNIELAADDICDTRQQLVNLDAKRHKTREALNSLKEQQRKQHPPKRHWVCVGDMFVRLSTNEARNLIVDDQYHIDTGIEKLRDGLHEKVENLRVLEGKPQLTGFNLKALNKEEILALRTGFKI